ncbi:MAG: (S)-ureidoglycine aminohydrolase [Pseudomonadota bacterium]
MHTGLTRTAIHADHAVVTPESYVPLQVPGFDNALTVVLISAELGADFAQYRVTGEGHSRLNPLGPTREYFWLLRSGSATLTVNGAQQTLGVDDYAFLPASTAWTIEGREAFELIGFEREYEPLPGVSLPAPVVQPLAAVPAEPFLGDEGALLQTLLPEGPAFDWGVNLFEFAPGGTLPQVESHFMAHGLFVLGGQGVYRLGDRWYPVVAGDAIWMAPYLLQWYVAAGKTPTRYLYFKVMNRVPRCSNR